MSFFGNSITDTVTGAVARVLPRGQLQSEPQTLLVGHELKDDTVHWTKENSGTGSSVTIGTKGVLLAGTSALGYAILRTAHRARFMLGTVNRYRATIAVNYDYICTGGVKLWGAMDLTGFAVDSTAVFGDLPFWSFYTAGYYFGLVDGVLHIGAHGETTQNYPLYVASGNFTGDVPSFKLDADRPYECEIYYDDNGASYYIDGVYLGSLLSKNKGLALTTGNETNWNLPLDLYASAVTMNKRTGAASDQGRFYLLQQNISRIGVEKSAPLYYRASVAAQSSGSGIIKRGSGLIRRVVNLDTTATQTLNLYDAVSATNLIGSFDLTKYGSVELEVYFQTGLYYSVSNGPATVLVIYE